MGYTIYWTPNYQKFNPKFASAQEAFAEFSSVCERLYHALPKYYPNCYSDDHYTARVNGVLTRLPLPLYEPSHPLGIAGWDGEGTPEFTPENVRFNGDSSQKIISGVRWECSDEVANTGVITPDQLGYTDAAHETFSLTFNDAEWSFCKTAQKPYTLLVAACLVNILYYFPRFDIASDGGAEHWRRAAALYTKVTERQLPDLRILLTED